MTISRALISVSDKTGLLELATFLQSSNIEILSSGGTAQYLTDHQIATTEVSEFTHAPEMLDGRVKTLHPKIHGGILFKRNNPEHVAQINAQQFKPIDVVIVNLYPFEETLKKTFDHAALIEKIDIGGPALLRSAAKNYTDVTVLTSPDQYRLFIEDFKNNNGNTSLAFRQTCSQMVFEKTASYDASIASYFQSQSRDPLPTSTNLGLNQKLELRYGENPQQPAHFALPSKALGQTVLNHVLQGKQLSYNNLLDVHAAVELMRDVQKDFTVAILKHTNPCGIGRSTESLVEAYAYALAADPLSAFGGIVIFSHEVNRIVALKTIETFTEIMIAPSFSEDALALLEKKKNIRLITLAPSMIQPEGIEIKKILDGYLIQQPDMAIESVFECTVATFKTPSTQAFKALDLAWRVCKHVKSNAIVIANQNQTLGIGAGQMNRLDSTHIALEKAKQKNSKMQVLASDAFFPFADSIELAHQYGIEAIVQPGGSIKDIDVINAANQHGIAMVFTNVRHFKH